MVRPMVHSTKHYVQNSLNTIVAGAATNFVMIDAVNVVDKNTTNEVEEGSHVKAIYIEQWVRTGDTSPGSFIMAIYKVPGGGSTFSTGSMAAIGNVDNKKNILYFTQGLNNDQDADAITPYRGWLKIPKSKQRFGLGDRLVVTIFAQALDVINCGFSTYKEYT